MIKTIFFDVDGTLISHTLHDVPPSTRAALRQLQEKGIPCVVATGRHLLELETLPVKDIPFDGYVTLNGQLCLDRDKRILFDSSFTDPDKTALAALFQEKTLPVMLVEKGAMYINYIDPYVEKAQAAISTPLPDVGTYTGNDFYQAIVYLGKEQEASLSQLLPNCDLARWNAYAVDIIPRRGGKTAGMAAYLEKAGIAPCDTMAFGDGENDTDMLDFVGLGVAMGNAEPQVKAHADYVTGSVDEDGIAEALKFWKIIE